MMTKKAWKDRVDWTARKSRLAKKICEYFKDKRNEELTFGEILDKYCKKGMSIDTAIETLSQLVSGISIKRTALHEAWRASYARGNCQFVFHSKWPGNPYHGNRGIIRNPQKKNQPKLEKYHFTFVCQECKKKFKETKTTGTNLVIGLRVKQCPKCKKFGTLAAAFDMEGKTHFKIMVDGQEKLIKPKEKSKCRKELVGL